MARLSPPAKETSEIGTDKLDLSAGAMPGGASSSSDPPRRPTRSETQYRRNVRGIAPLDAAARAAGRVARLTREEVAEMQERAPSRFELRSEERSQSALKDIVRSPDSLAEVLQRVPQDSQHDRVTVARAQRARDDRRGDREQTQQSGREGQSPL